LSYIVNEGKKVFPSWCHRPKYPPRYPVGCVDVTL